MNTTNIVIIEDEVVTARNLAHLLKEIDNNINLVNTLDTVVNSVIWFNENQSPVDLIFMDIRLADGLSFDIFKATKINCPVIFVTAYNDYAITAFKNNGIDYILKPFDEEEIRNAYQKFKLLTGHTKGNQNPSINEILAQLGSLYKTYKKSFFVHYRDKLLPIETIKIAWFYTAHEIVYATTIENSQYVIDFTMEQLEQQLSPEYFFRANRQFIINRNAIIEVDFYFNGRLSVKVKPNPTEHILISKARVPEFKRWMNS